MEIYLHSENAERSARYPVTVSPAGDVEFVSSDDVLAEWVNAKGDPKQFEILFAYGVAEVPDPIGRYMVARGIAHRSRLLRRVVQLFDAAGRALGDVFDQNGRRVLLDVRAS